MTQQLQKKTNIRNGVFGALDFFVGAIALLIATPIFLKTLGGEQYGILVIANTVLGMGGLFSLGMGQATLKFVSKYLALGESDKVNDVIKSTYTIYLLIGIFCGCLGYALSGFLVDDVFQPSDTNRDDAIQSLRIVSIGFLFYYIASVFDSALKGAERFDCTTVVDVVIRVSVIIIQILLAVLGDGLPLIIAVPVFGIAITALTKSFLVKRVVCKTFNYLPGIKRSVLKEVFSFGVYTWLGSIFGLIRKNGDVMIVGAVVGIVEVGYYSIAMRLLGQVHNLLLKASSFLFPYTSKLHETNDQAQLALLYEKVNKVILVASSAMIVPIFIFSYPIIVIWLGVEKAQYIAPLVQIMAVRYALYPLSIVNSMFMLGTSKVKAMAVVTLLSCILILPLTAVLAKTHGVVGAAWAQAAVILIVCFNRMYLEKSIFGKCSAITQVALFTGALMPLFLAYPLVVNVSMPVWKILLVGASAVVVGALTSYVIFEGLKKLSKWIPMKYSIKL